MLKYKTLFIALIPIGMFCFGQKSIANKGTGKVTAVFNNFNSAGYYNKSCVLSDGRIFNFMNMDNKENLSYSESLKDNLPLRMFFAIYEKSGKKISGWYRKKNLQTGSYLRGCASSIDRSLIHTDEILISINEKGFSKNFYPQIPGTLILGAHFLDNKTIRIYTQRTVKGKFHLYQVDWTIETNAKNKTTIEAGSDFEFDHFFKTELPDMSKLTFEDIKFYFRKRRTKETTEHYIHNSGAFIMVSKLDKWFDNYTSTSTNQMVLYKNASSNPIEIDINNIQLRKVLASYENDNEYGVLVHGKLNDGSLGNLGLILIRLTREGKLIGATLVVDSEKCDNSKLKSLAVDPVMGVEIVSYDKANGKLVLIDNKSHHLNVFSIDMKF
jgi:hypothetical protein